jgi:hypothetical protein
MQGDDRHGHVRQTRATAVDKRLQQLQADGRRPRSFSPARTHTHGQGKSCADARPPPDWKTYGAWSASCPHDLQQAKGRRDKMHGDDRHGRRPRGANTWNVAQTLATAVDKRLQQLKSEGRRTRSFSPARTGAHGQDTSKPCCGLHDKGNAYELALWKSCEGTFRRHSVSAIDLVKMREAARALWNTPRTCTCSLNSPPQRDERPSAPLQAGRANMMPCTRSPVELASSVMRLMHIVVAFFFAVVSFLTLMLPSFSALTSPLWGPRSKLADSQWQRPQRKPLYRSASTSASFTSAESESVPLSETSDDEEHYGCDKGCGPHRRALTSEWASYSETHYPNQCQRRLERMANFFSSGAGFRPAHQERALTF